MAERTSTANRNRRCASKHLRSIHIRPSASGRSSTDRRHSQQVATEFRPGSLRKRGRGSVRRTTLPTSAIGNALSTMQRPLPGTEPESAMATATQTARQDGQTLRPAQSIGSADPRPARIPSPRLASPRSPRMPSPLLLVPRTNSPPAENAGIPRGDQQVSCWPRRPIAGREDCARPRAS